MLNLAIVTYQYYKTTTRGGERHLLFLARILQKFSNVTIITTQSKEHTTWENKLKNDTDYIEKRIKVKRFPVDFQIKLRKINDLNHYLHANTNHSLTEEEEWIKKIGPYSSNLFAYLKEKKNDYDLFFFNSHANPITYYGLPLVQEKSILIPFCHEEPSFYFKIFDLLFTQPRLIMSNTKTETYSIHKRFKNHSPIINVGININNKTTLDTKFIKNKYSLNKPYFLFIGRVERNKGIFELINNYIKLSNLYSNIPDLIILGEKTYSIATPKTIRFLQKVSDEEKLAIIKNSLLVINPSYYESLSLVLLEAWSQKIPVVVNAACNVLKKQVEFSQGGLYYENFSEFKKIISLLLNNQSQRHRLGQNGYNFYYKNYRKEVISRKIEILVKNLVN